MKVSLSWLQEFVRVDVPVEKLVDLLNLSGTKVEAVHRPSEEVIEGIRVAEVVDISDHPNADNLTLVEVKLGGDETERVVCGARNFAVGDRVPLATVGAHLPGMDITERKIRGEVSRGMLCSGAELGISKDHSGILVLPPDAELGADVGKVLALDDTVIELEITPNRPDCMSMIGVAREVGALLGHEVTRPEMDAPVKDDLRSPVTVDIQDPDGCPRYVARYLEDVTIGPSPSWLATRLLRAGVRPISNVVDVTNYVMLELGQPLHAFDATRIDGRKIVVRRAKRGERFRTLDDVDRSMTTDDLMIADPKKALAIAGVMGGEDSEVAPDTTTVILESAYFDPTSVSLTARRQLLRTEASARFERGADPEAQAIAASRAARLIAELCGASVSPDVADENPRPFTRRTIAFRPARTGVVLGKDIAPDAQASWLRAIDLGVQGAGDDLTVDVPGFRPDLTREADLVEEVARLAGFEQLPSTLPPGRIGRLDPEQALDRAVRRRLSAMGVQEAWTNSFASEADLAALGIGDASKAVRIANPMSEDEDLLRTSLLPGLLRSAARNVAHRADGVALFELSHIYEASGDELPHEPVVLGAIFAGTRSHQAWQGSERRWDFFAAKGVLDALLAGMGMPQPTYGPVRGDAFHPTRAAQIAIGGASAGVLGELHPATCERFGVPEGTIALEVSFAPIAALIPPRVQVGDLPRFPAVNIDLAIVVDESTAQGDVMATIEAAGRPELASVRLFDQYRGDQVSNGKKSLAYALQLRDPDKTLTDEDAARVRERVVTALSERFGAKIR
ncbi:MAG: phenylalanine--tRNA ligase subunit beta [Actinomycetota bacterium]